MFSVNCYSLLFLVIDGEFHQIRFDEIVEFAVHDGINIGGLVVRAMIFHTTVVKDIRTYLTAPFYLFLAGFNLCLSLQALLHSAVIEL